MYYRSSRLGGRREAPGVKEEPPTEDITTATRSKPGEAGDEVLGDKTEPNSDAAKWEETH